jgi:hypothetical protein
MREGNHLEVCSYCSVFHTVLRFCFVRRGYVRKFATAWMPRVHRSSIIPWQSLGNTCHSYVLGVHDMIQDFEARNQITYYCGPQTPDTYQLALIVKKFLQDHSTSLHYSASSLVMSALSEAYACTNMPEGVTTPGNSFTGRDLRGYR